MSMLPPCRTNVLTSAHNMLERQLAQCIGRASGTRAQLKLRIDQTSVALGAECAMMETTGERMGHGDVPPQTFNRPYGTSPNPAMNSIMHVLAFRPIAKDLRRLINAGWS